MPVPPAKPSAEPGEPLPTDIHDEDPSTEGGPPGWMAFSILAGVFVIGVILLLFIFGLGGTDIPVE